MPRFPALAVLAALAAGAPPAATVLRAQSPLPDAGTGGALSARDTARLLGAARSEQSRYERVRRGHLPWAWGGGSGECDERIGRFCLTYDDGAPDWVAPPEDPEITEARDRLLERLAETGRILPGDGWTAGQRIRYLVEARRFDEAKRVAAECAAAPWWCRALAGFVHHYAGEPAPAHASFSDALRGMPAEVRRGWTDLSHLLDPDVSGTYRDLDADGRDAFAERFWALGDPFYTRPGNEFRSEHLARNVWDSFQERAKNTENLSWGSDLRQILLRYGWPVGWERVRERWGSMAGPSMLSHYPNSDRNFVPPAVLLREGEISAGAWDVESPRARTGYTVPLPDSTLRWLDTLDHQVAVFRRGDSAVVVATYEVPPDSFAAGGIEAALAVATAIAEPPRVVPFPAGGARDLLTVAARPGRLLLSLEVLAQEARRAARARYGLLIPPHPPGLLAVSDLLLLSSAESLPDSLPGALRGARPSTRVVPGERLGVYWEVYGLDGAEPTLATLSLRLLDERGGWLRRMAERVGLVSDDDPVRLRWQELAGGAPFVPRALAIQIPEIEPGSYTLELSVALPGREPLTVERALRVRSPR